MKTPTVIGLAATVIFAAPALAQQQEQLAEIDKPATELNQILADQPQLPEGASEVRVIQGSLDPKTTAAWHTHPSPVYVFVQEGSLMMELEGQEPREIKAGEATAEPLDQRMRVINRGDEPAKFVVFQISPPQKAFLEEEKAAQPKAD